MLLVALIVVIGVAFVVVVITLVVDENLFDAQTRLSDKKMTQKPSLSLSTALRHTGLSNTPTIPASCPTSTP